jgi:hypothetical protein
MKELKGSGDTLSTEVFNSKNGRYLNLFDVNEIQERYMIGGNDGIHKITNDEYIEQR